MVVIRARARARTEIASDERIVDARRRRLRAVRRSRERARGGKRWNRSTSARASNLCERGRARARGGVRELRARGVGR